ncbi:MAG TPA: HAMP domain-containing sensor histidine kinase [Ktedonobacteraceae bacterium]|nr:HAMP domain-containing sensor histidine kinase [Ktedonobacteraceae bacterium]
MKTSVFSNKPVASLRVQLLLSFLGVALGAIILLAVVVTLVVQNYFFNWQQQQVRVNATNLAQSLGISYRSNGGSWIGVQLRLPEPALLVLVDSQGNPLISSKYIPVSEDEFTTINTALQQALQGQTTYGQLQAGGSAVFSGYYACLPVRYNGQSSGKIIGAMFYAVPQHYQGFSPYDFLTNVNQAIFIAGIILTLGVVVFSLFLARRLTRPLERLTEAAEQMGQGNYAQRVEPPKGRDELERLALSFNAMAERIESDINELRHQEELRRDLIANIAHDLATPLTAIQGFSEALADDVITDTGARQETAQLIGREVQRLRRLVGEIQQMTSLESGRAHLEFAPLDLRSLVDETLAVIEPECEQAGIRLRNEIAPSTPPVLADSDRITQVLLNLLDNARRHTPAGGTIAVRARPIGRVLEIEVKDTGVGINPEDLPYIFERFYRADRSRTGSTGGSGLGLSIVKAIISAHGGSARAESTPGAGTSIFFTLPLVAVEEHTRPVAKSVMKSQV